MSEQIQISWARRNVPNMRMKPIPETNGSLVLRTDFSDSATWDAVCSNIQAPQSEFRAYVHFISDRDYDGIAIPQLVPLATEIARRTFMFIVDRTTMTHEEHPVAVLDLWHKPGRTFRVIPSQMWSVENNLSLANMDFFEFADAVGDDGIFRGFPKR
jgi:hypothetical protein